MTLGTVAAFAACSGEAVAPPTNSTKPVNSIQISPPTASINVSGTLQLSAILQDVAGATLSGRTVTWTSDAGKIATVSASGLVATSDTGTATITASSEGKSASAKVTVTPVGTTPKAHAGYYASLSGSSSGDGSVNRPWDLPTALAATATIHGGDTLWIRGGTYHGNYRSTLTGTASAPVVVRQYPGERAIIDGGGYTPSTWYVAGQYSEFWGFELTNSTTNRVLTSTERRSNVIANYASHTKYINLVVHDGGVAFYNESPYLDVEIVGCVIYNEGWQGPDRGHGHAIYLRSNTGPVTARDNILFNQFGYGVHVFTNPGEGQLNNVHVEGNISFNNGTLSTNSSSSNILFGGDDYSTGGVLKNNYTYESPGLTAVNVQVGYGATKNGTVQLLSNYFAGGTTVVDVGYWSSFTATSNILMGTSQVVQLSDPALSMSKFTGQTQASLPTTTKVVVRANPYEKGRANIAVYNWSQQGSVDIDLSGIVPAGASYEIRNVQTLFGAPVVSGTYRGGTVTLPMRAVTPPVPTGMASSHAPSTGTAFNAYVVSIRQ
ncbi:MAG: Ig-like domain-containing protein [Gemmatimonadales bacterium]